MPRVRTAHKFTERQRTGDVLTEELVDFKSLLLSADVLKGLSSSGFERPSPIQLKAIPLGRCGLDLIAQAKSGTGKTCVFSVIALESLLLNSDTTQVLILAPTREIAAQIKDVISAIGSQMNNLVCHVFIGGLPVEDNKKVLKKPCHIAVGTPGRIKFLIENGFLKTDSMRLFILDEADKLLEDNFQEQINWIFSSLPSNKQMMAFSATYPEYLAEHLTLYMREPTFIRLNATDPTLQGIKQFYQLVPFHPLPHKTFQEKVAKLLSLLSSVAFNQCLVFSNYQIRAQSLCDTLRLKGWPSVFIAGNQSQSQRLKAIEKLKEFKCRVLISTDLTSRGIDAEHVNLVVNMDVPRDHETYLHRIGRAGRFGTQGIAVTYVAKGEEEKLFKKMEETIGVTIDTLPDPIPQFFCTSEPSGCLASKSLLPGKTTVEIDIMKNSAKRKSKDSVGLDNLGSNTIQDHAECSDELDRTTGKTVVRMDQQSSTIEMARDLEDNSEILHSQSELQELQIEQSAEGYFSEKTQTVEHVTLAAQQSVPTQCPSTRPQNQTCESFHGTKLLENGQGSYAETQGYSSQAGDDTEGIPLDKSEVELTAGSDQALKALSLTELADNVTTSSLAEMSDDLLNKLQDLNLESHLEMLSLSTGSTLRPVSNGHSERLVNFQIEDTGVDELSLPSAEEKKSPKSRLRDVNVKHENASKTSRDDDGVLCHSRLETKDEDTSQLPTVEEFEKHFEEYLKNVSNLQHYDMSINSSDLECDAQSHGSTPSSFEDEAQGIDTFNECFHKKSAEPLHSMASHHVSRNTHVHKLQKNSNSGISDGNNRCTVAQSARGPSVIPQHFDAFPSSTYNQMFGNTCRFQNVTFCDYCRNNSSGFEQVQYCTDHSSACYSAQWDFDNYCSDPYIHFTTYDHNQCDHYDNQDTFSTDHLFDRNGLQFPKTPQQHFDPSFEDIRWDQNSQWNMKWGNAYYRQVYCIKQFVSLSRRALGLV